MCLLHLSAYTVSLFSMLVFGLGASLLVRRRQIAPEAHYRLLFEQNAAGVCVISRDGTIVESNHVFASLVRCEYAELTGQKLRDLYVRPFEYDDLFGLVLTLGVANGVE